MALQIARRGPDDRASRRFRQQMSRLPTRASADRVRLLERGQKRMRNERIVGISCACIEAPGLVFIHCMKLTSGRAGIPVAGGDFGHCGRDTDAEFLRHSGLSGPTLRRNSCRSQRIACVSTRDSRLSGRS
jgi:hypothetical protein